MGTPYSLAVLEEVPSTQDAARAQASGSVPAVVVAHRQSGGRGRSGARWETAPRAVAVSVAFSPDWPDRRLLPLAAAVAARRVLGPSVGLKWPNDVIMSGDKVGGILVEAHDGLVVAGLGLNIWWPGPPPGVGALRETDPGAGIGPVLAESWVMALLTIAASPPWPHQEYVAGCVTLGADVVWEPSGAGRAIDVAEDGALVVVTATGEERLYSGAVHHVRTV